MRFLSARRALATGIVAAASLAAVVAPGSAMALGHCEGENIKGRGATFPEEAHKALVLAFNEKAYANKGGCGTVKVEYNDSGPLGSGGGYNEWAKEHHYGSIGFVGTDNTVNAAEKTVVEKQAEEIGNGEGKKSKLMTVPLLQGALAIIVHLPEHCKVTSAGGRLRLNQNVVNGIYEGTIKTWKQVEEEPNAGNKLGEDGGACDNTKTITPFVRLDGSGTTHIFKEALFKNHTAKDLTNENGEGPFTWGELAEGTNAAAKCTTAKDSKLNECWPLAAGVVHASTSGNPGVIEGVASTASSIGYADLSQARTKGGFAPGTETSSPQKFWAEIENSQKLDPKTGLVKSRKYADPSTDGYSNVSAESNCKKTEYVNGTTTFPPENVYQAFNEVGAKRESKGYAYRGLTYMLVNTDYSAYSNFGGNFKEAQSVKDYLAFVTSKKAGGKAMKGKDYYLVPGSLSPVIEEALAAIKTS